MHSQNQAYPPNKVITQCTQYVQSPCCFGGPRKQFKWTEHTSITGVATTGLDTLSVSPRQNQNQNQKNLYFRISHRILWICNNKAMT